MLVLTVQKYSILQQVYSKHGYFPNFEKSECAFLSPKYTKGYQEILKSLSDKTCKDYVKGVDSCMWGWVKEPFLGFYPSNVGKSQKDRLYAVFCNIPEEDMVLSDYDKFCDYIEGYSNRKDFVIDNIKDAECVQCSFWRLQPENIQIVMDIDNLKSSTLLYEMSDAPRERVRDVSFIFDYRFQQMAVC